MAAPTWQNPRDVLVEAKLAHGYWTLALDYLDHGTRLRFEVNDAPSEWKYGDTTCSADGANAILLNSANTLLPEAPPGALIAKIGGSRVGKKDGVTTFVVGSFCVIELTDKQ